MIKLYHLQYIFILMVLDFLLQHQLHFELKHILFIIYNIYMKDIKSWFSFIVYLMIWVFIFKLFDLYTKGFSDNSLKKICILGLIIFGLIYNMDFIKH